MLKFWELLFFFEFLMISGISLRAQCPDDFGLTSQINKFAGLPDRNEAIRNLKLLASQRTKCGEVKDSTYALLLHSIGRVYWYDYQLDSAIAYTSKALRINSSKARSAKYADLANGYFNLALIYSERNELVRALSLLDSAELVASKFPEKKFILASGYSLKANIHTALGSYEAAILNAEVGYGIAKAENNRDLMARNLVEKAQALIYMKHHADADLVLEQAMRLVSSDNHERLGPIYSLMAENAIESDDAKKVVHYYKKAFNSFKTKGDAIGCGQSAASLAYFYRFYRGDFDKAKREYDVALKYLQSPLVRAIVYNDLSEVYRESRDFSESLKLKQTALSAAGLTGAGAPFDDNPSYSALVPVLDKISLLTIIRDKARTWYEYGGHTGNDKIKLGFALKTYMLADTMIDHMRWEHSGTITKLFWREHTKAMYEQAIETCFLLGDTEKAFYFLEKAKAVLLSDQLNELGAAHLLSEADRQEEQDLRAKMTDWQSKLGEADDSSVESIRSALFSTRQQLDTFIKSLEKSNPLYYAYKYDNNVPAISDVRNKILKENQTFLSYFVGDSAVYGLAIGPGKTVLKRIDLDRYKRLTNAFQTKISDRNTQNTRFAEYLEVSSQLYRLLIAPFDIPEGSRIVVSPDGSFLPFGAFSRSDKTPDFLVNHYTFSYTYSAVVLGKMHRKSTGNWFSPGFFGMAPVKFAPALNQAALIGSEQALRTNDKYFFRSRLAIGDKATRAEFVRHSSGYRIVQLLTHAAADSAGNIPTLYFADTTLKLNELSLPERSLTELLILSACETGVGKNQRGEGVFSLARGFAATGIPSVLTTLWSVENEPVYRITQTFYDQMSAGLPLDIALQNAQKQWLQTASRNGQLPYVWAGMVLVGNTDPVEMGVAPRVLYLIAGIALLLALTAWQVVKRRSVKVAENKGN